jgi:hypothetical protein
LRANSIGIERVSAEVVQKASSFQAAILADVAGRRGTMNARVAPVHLCFLATPLHPPPQAM